MPRLDAHVRLVALAERIGRRAPDDDLAAVPVHVVLGEVQHAPACQLHRPHRHAHREHDRQRDRHRAHEQDQHQGQYLEEGHAAPQGDAGRHREERADDQEEPPDQGGHDGLDVQLRARHRHELGRPAEVGAPARQDDHAVRFPPAHERPRVHEGSRIPADVQRLARERRLVHRQFARHDSHVRRDDITGPEAHEIAGHELPGRDRLPEPVALRARRHAKARAQGLDGPRGPAFLDDAHDGVDQQQPADDDEIGVFLQDPGQEENQLERPGGESPELAQEPTERMGLRLGDLVVPLLAEAAVDLGPAEAGLSVDTQPGQHLGNARRRQVHAASGRDRLGRLDQGVVP